MVACNNKNKLYISQYYYRIIAPVTSLHIKNKKVLLCMTRSFKIYFFHVLNKTSHPFSTKFARFPFIPIMYITPITPCAHKSFFHFFFASVQYATASDDFEMIPLDYYLILCAHLNSISLCCRM